MPEIRIDEWDVASQNQKRDPGVIEGEARDITDQGTPEEESIDLSAEADFPEDRATLREDPAAALHNFASSLPFGPIRQLRASELSSKWRLFEQLTPTIPLNEFNLPNFYYRADMLDHQDIAQILISAHENYNGTVQGSTPATTIRDTPETPVDGHDGPQSPIQVRTLGQLQETLDAAMVSLEYHEGFPALPDGKPFWKQLDCEPTAAYDAFVFYLEAGSTRKRSDLIGYPTDDVNEWFHIYYWQYRAKAFELFKVVDHNKRRIERLINTEDSHYVAAERIFRTIADAIKGPEFQEKLMALDPEKLVGVLDKVVKIQRISTGLNANGGAVDPADLKKAPQTNVIVQQIVQNGAETVQKSEESMDILMDNPDAVELAQSLILGNMERIGVDDSAS